MHLSSLRLRDFRCFSEVSVNIPEGTSVFTGNNAQGKTSILEAICVLLRLQSPRAGKQQELVRFGLGGFGLAGTVEGRELRHLLEEGKRRLFVDSAAVGKSGDYLAAAGRIVWMGNGDLELVTAGGEPRRRYLDFLGSQLFPEYRRILSEYEKTLKQRNFLLKRDASPAWGEIRPFSELLSARGDALRELRLRLLDSLASHLSTAQGLITISGTAEELEAKYVPGHEGPMLQALEETVAEETRRRVTTVGPHRNDFHLKLNGLPAGTYASEGQQRSIALALKLAQASLLVQLTGQSPILLIDDVFGELDPLRRNALLAALPADSQRIITTTTLQWMDEGLLPQGVFKVDNAVISRMEL